MTTFIPDENLSDDAYDVLREMYLSGSSEAMSVVDCLNTIASNGDEQGCDEHLIGCAEEIRDWAIAFVTRLSKRRGDRKKADKTSKKG